jgi:hypothetical protein
MNGSESEKPVPAADDYVPFKIKRRIVDMMRVRREKTGEIMAHIAEVAIERYLRGE